jgi:2-aminoadipate transaminase
MTMAKQGTDLHTSTFNQIIAYEVAHQGFLDKHVKFICKVYAERRDVMLDALEEHMPDGVRWTHPEGGLFLWATLPEGINSTDVFQDAIQEKVAFVPGESFFPCGGGENTMRLNFSFCRPEVIVEGISRLGRVLKRRMK